MQYALISGASRGLGRSLVETFLGNGFAVFAGVLKSEKHLLDDIKGKHGDNLFVMEMDVTNENDIINAVKLVLRHTDRLDVVVNNAGIIFGNTDNQDNPLDIDLTQLSDSVNVNAYGGMLVAKHFVTLLRPASQSHAPALINITSEAGSLAGAAGCYDPYCISKSLMNIVSNKMKLLLEPRGIRVFAVHPGRMKTDMSQGKGDITPNESARGIADIVQGKVKVDEKEAFIDYLGQVMIP